jgi:hypothetical protein
MDIPSWGSRLRLWGGLAGSAVGLAALTTWLLLQVSGGDLDRGDKLASIASMTVTVVTLPLNVVAIVLTLRQPGTRLTVQAGERLGLAAGLLAGTGVWLLGATVRALGVPVEPTETISPTELLDTDRATALRQGLIVGIGGATVLWLTIRLTFEPAFGLPFGVVFPPALWLLGWLLAAGSGALLWILVATVWGRWLIARTWLSLTGRLPWPIMTFLTDAHRRGVLRQAGGVYQFRHARLQNHLAHHNKQQPQHTHAPPMTRPTPHK